VHPTSRNASRSAAIRPNYKSVTAIYTSRLAARQREAPLAYAWMGVRLRVAAIATKASRARRATGRLPPSDGRSAKSIFPSGDRKPWTVNRALSLPSLVSCGYGAADVLALQQYCNIVGAAKIFILWPPTPKADAIRVEFPHRVTVGLQQPIKIEQEKP
jgi:hypothetical protein